MKRIYDSDIRWMRWVVFGMIAGNLGMAAHSLWLRLWFQAIAYVFWAINCVIWSGVLIVQQETRDQARIVQSGALKVIEELDESL